jgi:hypothetical protein
MRNQPALCLSPQNSEPIPLDRWIVGPLGVDLPQAMIVRP